MNTAGKGIEIIETQRKGAIFCSHIQAVLDDKRERILRILLHTKKGILQSNVVYCEGCDFGEDYGVSLQKFDNGLMFFSVNEYSIGFSEGVIQENKLNNTNLLKKMLVKLEQIRKIVQKECAEQVERATNIAMDDSVIPNNSILKKVTKGGIKLLTGKISKRLLMKAEDNLEFLTKLIEEIEKVIKYYTLEKGKKEENKEYVNILGKVKIALIDIKTRLENKLNAEKTIMNIYGITD